MFARFQTTRTRPPADLADRVVDMFATISTHPGFAGIWLLPPIAADAGGLLTLWQTRDDAEQASGRTAAARGPRPVELQSDEIYRVAVDRAGAAADVEPTYAQLAHFDAPRTDEWSDAALRAGEERIWPALQDLGGCVRTLTLVGDGNAHLVVTLVTTLDAVEEGQRRIMSTTLLPWEEPAMLTGPDRIALHRVAAVRLPAST